MVPLGEVIINETEIEVMIVLRVYVLEVLGQSIDMEDESFRLNFHIEYLFFILQGTNAKFRIMTRKLVIHFVIFIVETVESDNATRFCVD